MKKALYGTTALGAIALMAGPAAAQDGKISLGVGGYYENFISFVFQDFDGNNEYNEVNVRHEGEIHFKGETTLDNGLTVGFDAQLEAITQSDQMDETYLYFTGSWGRLLMGAENSAPYLMQYTAPAAGLGVNSPNIQPFQVISAAGTSSFLNQVSDANKITYFTPRFFGFQLGASYTPNIDNVSGDRQSAGLNTKEDEDDYNNFFGVGLNFVESFNGIDVAVAGGFEYGMVEEDNIGARSASTATTIDTLETFAVAPGSNNDVRINNTVTSSSIAADDYIAYSFGANFGFSGFTVGGSFLNSNNGRSADRDTRVWDVGGTYGAGPWEIGVTFLRGKTETAGGDDKLKVLEVGGNYRLSPGVKVVGSFQYADDEDASANREEDAFGFTLGTRLDF